MLFVHVLVGAAAAAAILLLAEYVRQRGLAVPAWGWILAFLGVVYTAFTLEVIAGLLAEGAPQAALVSGMLLGLIAVIGWVLMGRYLFAAADNKAA